MPIGWYVVDPPVSGTVATTLVKLQANLIAVTILTGAQASILQKMQSSFIGSVPEVGSIDSTIQKIQASFNGIMQPQGAIVVTLQKVSDSFTGVQIFTGVSNSILQKLQSSFSGTQQYIGTLASTLQKIQTSLLAAQAQSGTVVSTLQKIQASFSGALPSKMSTFIDDFATQDAAKWIYTNASTSGGQLLLPDAGDITAVGRYDLSESSASIQVVQYRNLPSNQINFQVVNSAGNLFVIQWWAPDQKTYCAEAVGGAYNWDAGILTNDKWWRIRESAGTVYWDTSSDGVTWTNRRNKVWAIPSVTSTFPEIWTTSGASGGTAILDNFNLVGAKRNRIIHPVYSRHRLR